MRKTCSGPIQYALLAILFTTSCCSLWATTPTKVETSNMPVAFCPPGSSCFTGSTFTSNKQQAKCPRPTASGDAIFIIGQYGQGNDDISSIADYPSGSDTWAKDEQTFDGTNGQAAFVLRLNNASSGVRGATVNFTTAVGHSQAGCMLMNNIDTSGTPTDGTCGRAVSSTSPDCGAAIGSNGDELIYCVFQDSTPTGNHNAVTYTASSGMTLFAVDNFGLSACEYGNITGATNPSITSSLTGQRFVTVGVAYKTTTSGGSAPSGLYAPVIDSIDMNAYPIGWNVSLSGTTFTVNFPCPTATNVIDIGWTADTSNMIQSVSSSNPSLTWSHTTEAAQGSIFIGHFYATNVSGCGSNTTITFTTATTPDQNGSANDTSLTIWAIQPAAVLDQGTSWPCNSTGNSSAGSGPVVNTSCATTVASELVTVAQQEDFQTATSSSVNAGTIYDLEPDLGAYEALTGFQDGGAATVYAGATGGYTVTWTYSHYDTPQATIGNWTAQALAWKPGAGPLPQQT